MYDNYEVRGIYKSDYDGRLRIYLYCKETNEDKFMSYPKYLMEMHLGRYFKNNETVDHIDGNPLNNDISNLQVLDRKEHCYLDVLRNQDIVVNCAYCGKEFVISGSKIHDRNRSDRKQSGYFCSRSCAGKYGKEIQMGLREPQKVDRIIPIKYKAKSAQGETPDVEKG